MTIAPPEIRAMKAALAEHRKAVRKARPPKVMPTADGQRKPRVRDNVKLAWIRRLPCVAGLIEGGCEGAVQACHLRMSLPGKPNPGMGAKPDDAWTWPGCAHHHLDDQHRGSEAVFFARLGIDPASLCTTLHAAYVADMDGPKVLRDFVGGQP